MKKIQLRFDAQQLTKEQMKKVTGGELCAGTVNCYNDADFYCGQVAGAIDCGEVGNLQDICTAVYGDDCDFVGGCNCN